MSKDTLVSVRDGDPGREPQAVDEPCKGEPARADHVALEVVAHEDAALGVARRVAGVDADALEPRHVLQEREHDLEPRGVGHRDLVPAGGDGGLAGDLLARGAHAVLEGVSELLVVHIQVPDGLALAHQEAVELLLHSAFKIATRSPAMVPATPPTTPIAFHAPR